MAPSIRRSKYTPRSTKVTIGRPPKWLATFKFKTPPRKVKSKTTLPGMLSETITHNIDGNITISHDVDVLVESSSSDDVTEQPVMFPLMLPVWLPLDTFTASADTIQLAMSETSLLTSS